MSIIKDLKVENEKYSIINSKNENWLNKLSKVNIFVGANNTGKSRFMRSLFYVDKDYKLKFLPNDSQFDILLKQSDEFKRTFSEKSKILKSQIKDEQKQIFLKVYMTLNLSKSPVFPTPI